MDAEGAFSCGKKVFRPNKKDSTYTVRVNWHYTNGALKRSLLKTEGDCLDFLCIFICKALSIQFYFIFKKQTIAQDTHTKIHISFSVSGDFLQIRGNFLKTKCNFPQLKGGHFHALTGWVQLLYSYWAFNGVQSCPFSSVFGQTFPSVVMWQPPWCWREGLA